MNLEKEKDEKALSDSFFLLLHEIFCTVKKLLWSLVIMRLSFFKKIDFYAIFDIAYVLQKY